MTENEVALITLEPLELKQSLGKAIKFGRLLRIGTGGKRITVVRGRDLPFWAVSDPLCLLCIIENLYWRGKY